MADNNRYFNTYFTSYNICPVKKSTDRTRKFKRNNPIKYVYQTLKANAKRRGKRFTIQLQEFENFILGTEYMEKKGRFYDDYTIDRVNNELGYEPGNLAVISRRKNQEKYINHDRHPIFNHDIKDHIPF